jgi:SAM-dependent methyltransferase
MSNPAEGYESCMVPTLFGSCAANLIQAANPKPGERVLDVGCGTGIVARQVASRLAGSATVTGFNLSPNMLAVAKAAAEREGLQIEWREGNAEQLPFPDSSFDLVLCQFALMFVGNKAAHSPKCAGWYAKTAVFWLASGRVSIGIRFTELCTKLFNGVLECQSCRTSLQLAVQPSCANWRLVPDFGK